MLNIFFLLIIERQTDNLFRHQRERVDEIPLETPDIQSTRADTTLVTNQPEIMAIKCETREDKGN